jgi:peptidylprolyl isomerase
MKKSIIIASTIFLSSTYIFIETKNTANDLNQATLKISKNKSCSLKTGDGLNLSEFTKTNSGIMYKIIQQGIGNKPCLGETVVVHYTGYLLVDGKKIGVKFDSSLDRDTPFSFRLGARQVISGWEISLADMKIGETRIVILPSKLAYGNRALSKIPADSTLVFEITLIKAS